MKKKGYAKGGMKKKGYAKGGMKKKGYAKGGMKKKGYSVGGVSTTKPKPRPKLQSTSKQTARANRLAASTLKMAEEFKSPDFKKAHSLIMNFVKKQQKKK